MVINEIIDKIGVGDKKNAFFTKDGVWDRRWQNVSVEWSPLPPAVSVMHFARVTWHRWDANHFSKLTIMHNVPEENQCEQLLQMQTLRPASSTRRGISVE